MRRKLYYLTAGLAATLLLAAACSSDDTAEKPVPEPAPPTAPTLTLSADAVLVDPERSDQPALHAEWTAATDDEQTEVAYTLYVNLTGRDMFSGPVVIDKGAALTHDFTHGELNQLLLNTFDLEAGAEAAVRFAVYAKNADEEFDAQLSEIISCAITPKTTYPNFPPSLIMVGAATPWQWDLNAGLELPESREGSHLYQASGVELRVQPMSLNNGFKFYFSRNVNDTDDPRFAAQDLSAETFGKIAVYKSGEAQFQPGSFGYENGVYDIEVNLDTKLLTLTRTGDLPEAPLPEQLYLLGGCFTWGWTWDGTQLAKAEEGILGILLNFPELMPAASGLLTPDDFFTEYGRAVYEALQALCSQGKLELGQLNERFNQDQMGRIMRIKMAREGLLNNETVLKECAEALKQAKAKKEMNINEIIDAKRRKQNDR